TDFERVRDRHTVRVQAYRDGAVIAAGRQRVSGRRGGEGGEQQQGGDEPRHAVHQSRNARPWPRAGGFGRARLPPSPRPGRRLGGGLALPRKPGRLRLPEGAPAAPQQENPDTSSFRTKRASTPKQGPGWGAPPTPRWFSFPTRR